MFDKVVLLYEGRQIFFGGIHTAKSYFEAMGFRSPDGATTTDFLTSLTNPDERMVRPGYEARVPRTANDFAERWRTSIERSKLLEDIKQFNRDFPPGQSDLSRYRSVRSSIKATSL